MSIVLDCSGTFSEFDKLEVTFIGVTQCSMPENFENAWWLYHEIALTEDGFELGILFDSPFREVTICAKRCITCEEIMLYGVLQTFDIIKIKLL